MYKNINIQKIILTTLLILTQITINQQIKLDLDLSPISKSLILFNKKHNKQIYLQWDFNSTQIILDDKYKQQKLFLDLDRKYSLGNFKIIYKNKIQKTLEIKQQQQLIIGSIGMAEHNDFMAGLKQLLNTAQIKLWFRINDNRVQVIPLKCFKPLFPPYNIQVKSWSSINFEVNKPSFMFQPSQIFLAVLNRTKTPFKMSNADLNNLISLTFEQQTKTFKSQHFLHSCSKFSHSSDYQCEVKTYTGTNVNLGKLLMQFQPVICSKGIQLEPTIGFHQNSSGYYWLHLILLCLQILVMIICVYQEQLITALKNTKKSKLNLR